MPRDAIVRAISPVLGGSIALAEIEKRRVAIVADEDENAISFVDLETNALLSTTKLDGAPGQLLLAPDGTLFVAVRGAARVLALRFFVGGTVHEVARHTTADEPFGLALTPDHATLLVSTILDPGVEALRAKDLEPVFRAELPRDPRSIVVTADGARAFVSHAVGSAASVIDLKAEGLGNTRKIALDAHERRRDFGQKHVTKPMPPSMHKTPSAPPEVRIRMTRSATQGFGLAMIGGKVMLPETLVMTSDNTEIPTGYGSVAQSTLSTHVPFTARVDADEKLENADFSGPSDRECFEQKTECIVPRAVTADDKYMYVACLDSDEVLVVDPTQDDQHAPACQKSLKNRAHLHVDSPTAVAIDPENHRAVVFSSFTRRVSTIAIDAEPNRAPATELTLARSAASPELVEAGRRIFHHSADPRVSKNGRTCASCHVDGRDDGLVWPTPMGKRQTPMLAGRLEGTAPYGWNGEHPSLVVHIKSTVKNLEGTGLGDHEYDALAAYVGSMHAPVKRAAKSEAITKGQAIFRSSDAGCSSCHTEETRFTDLGTHRFPSTKEAYDTPSLAFVGQTAPYFHDGRFATLEALVDGCGKPDTRMGETSQLSPEDRGALVAYLRSL